MTYRSLKCKTSGLAASILAASLAALHAAGVANLRCEYRNNPLGINDAKPRLSWMIESIFCGRWRKADAPTSSTQIVATTVLASSAFADPEGALPDGSPVANPVPLVRMQQVYEEVKTPFKYGIVIRGEEGQNVDCPTIFRQKDQWYMVYVGISPNNKTKIGYEKIGMAVSDDMIHWKRYGTEPVVVNGEDKQNGISGDPQIVRMGDLWVMFYFGAFWKPKAFDTFACSNDLVHWTKWDGPHLVEPSEQSQGRLS